MRTECKVLAPVCWDKFFRTHSNWHDLFSPKWVSSRSFNFAFVVKRCYGDLLCTTLLHLPYSSPFLAAEQFSRFDCQGEKLVPPHWRWFPPSVSQWLSLEGEIAFQCSCWKLLAQRRASNLSSQQRCFCQVRPKSQHVGTSNSKSSKLVQSLQGLRCKSNFRYWWLMGQTVVMWLIKQTRILA